MNDEPKMAWTLEGWRGLAACMVVAAHYAAPAGLDGTAWGFAFTGVDLFFVLSGFVFGPHWLWPRPMDWRAYALRRVFRIYPAYLVGLSVMAALAFWQGRALLYLPQHLLMLHLQSREMAFYYNPAFWSLPAEAAFYLVLPWLAAWAAGRSGRLWALAAVALAMRLGLLLAADPTAQNSAYIGLHNLPGIALEFAVGIAARGWAEHRRNGSRIGQPAWLPVLWIGLSALAWLGLASVFQAARQRGWGFAAENAITLLSTLCFAVALVMGVGLERPAPLATGRWCQRLAGQAGNLSYSIYLLHMAWLHWAQHWQPAWGTGAAFGSALAGTLISAWMLHAWVEAPARRWARDLAARMAPAQNTSVSPG